MDEVASVKSDVDGRVAREPVPTVPEFAWMAFRAPFEQGLHDATGELVFTDYGSAGTMWKETNRFRVWLPQILDPSRAG